MKFFYSKYWREVFDPAMIVKTTLQTIIGSVLIGAFFMVSADYIFTPIDMNGRWNLMLIPNEASSKKNRCVNITYSVLFVQNGLKIVGGGEKSRDEKSLDSACKDQVIFERTIALGKGQRIDIAGFIENNYIAKDFISFSYQEGESSNLRFTMGVLSVTDNDEIRGWYKSNISRAKGDILLSRQP